MVTTTGSQMACHECDLLTAVPALEAGQKAYCPRCNYLLAAHRPHALTMVFAFGVSGLVFLLLSTAFPFLGFNERAAECFCLAFDCERTVRAATLSWHHWRQRPGVER